MDPESVEHELARRARDGDREALAQLVEQERLPLFTLAYAHLRHYDDAQDVLAATMLQICRHIEELREPERVRAWMQTILRNEARQCRRHSFPEPLAVDRADEVEERSGCSSAAASEAEAVASLMRLDILRALRRLPWDEARTVALFYLAGLPIREIAQHLDRPEGTIKRWLYLGRQHLATELEDYAPRGWTGRSSSRNPAAPLNEPVNCHGRPSIQ
jgi:RNA polymerase sigma-70 factor, ECF subfamily